MERDFVLQRHDQRADGRNLPETFSMALKDPIQLRRCTGHAHARPDAHEHAKVVTRAARQRLITRSRARARSASWGRDVVEAAGITPTTFIGVSPIEIVRR